MCISMPKNTKEERLRWILLLVRKEMTLKKLSKVCPHSERSLKRWKALYLRYGEEGLIPKSTAPKTHPYETPIAIKEEVIALRKDTTICCPG